MAEKESESLDKKTGKSYQIIINKYLLILVLVIAVFGIKIIYHGLFSNPPNAKICGDETPYNECSSIKPYFCFNRTLVERASFCSCPEVLTQIGDSCVSKYQNNSKTVTLKYILRGEEKEINFIAYKNMNDYISKTSRFIGGEEVSRQDFKLKNIDEKEQRELLLPLVIQIQNLAGKENDDARIAVSIIQSINYGASNKSLMLGNQNLYSRYAYEVLYDEKGVCGEKSELLAFLLREMGYGVVIFYYPFENHEAVGIKCPEKYSLDGSGYCFVETTGQSIITDNKIEYVGGKKLISEPEIIFISDGKSLSDDLYEYDDAEDLVEMRKNGVGVFSSNKFNFLKKKYGLVEDYNI